MPLLAHQKTHRSIFEEFNSVPDNNGVAALRLCEISLTELLFVIFEPYERRAQLDYLYQTSSSRSWDYRQSSVASVFRFFFPQLPSLSNKVSFVSMNFIFSASSLES